MKKLAIAPAVAFVLLGFTATALPYQNEPTGFHGMAWGTPLSAVQGGLRQTGDYDEGLEFVKPYDDMQLGIVPLDSLFYYFRNGVFDSVEMRSLGGPGAPDVIIESFKRTFGPPTAQIPPSLMTWRSDTTFILLSCDTNVSCIIAMGRSSTGPNDAAPISNVQGSPQSSTAQKNTNQKQWAQQDQRRSYANLSYQQCMRHCTNMAIICNTGSEESIYTPSSQLCDTKFHNCEADCAVTLKRQWGQ